MTLFTVYTLVLIATLKRNIISGLLGGGFDNFLNSVACTVCLGRTIFVCVNRHSFGYRFQLLILISLTYLITFSTIMATTCGGVMSGLGGGSFGGGVNNRIG